MFLLGVTTGDHTSKANFALISSSLSEESYIKMIFKVFESHWDFVISYQKQSLTVAHWYSWFVARPMWFDERL